jgi:hypothetical protein
MDIERMFEKTTDCVNDDLEGQAKSHVMLLVDEPLSPTDYTLQMDEVDESNSTSR